MDLIKTGRFLSELRHEKKLTQEELGEILGVTNKTISRWENGNYLPPAEMLQLLSEQYNVSINEILSGERLTSEGYKEKAEENIRAVIEASCFSIREKEKFFKDKWEKDNRFTTILAAVIFVITLSAGILLREALVITAAYTAAAAYIFISRARMTKYIEDHVYGEAYKWNKNK